MQNKEIKFGDDLRKRISDGVDLISNAVKVTMGARGRNVMIGRGSGMAPRVTKDGVTVAKNVSVSDKWRGLGVEMVKEASQRTNDLAGDGTTATCVLAQAIYREAGRRIMGDSDPMAIYRGLNLALARCVEEIKKESVEVKDVDTLKSIGRISANDSELGDIIAETMFDLGPDGLVTVETAEDGETDVRRVDGMQLDGGIMSPYLVTNRERMECEIEDASVILFDGRISLNSDLVPALQRLAMENQRSIVIVAEDVTGGALATVVQNKLGGNLNITAIKAPGFGARRLDLLEDIAAVTGATVLSEQKGTKLADLTLDQVGKVRRVVANDRRTVFVEGGGSKESRDERVAQIEGLSGKAKRKWEKDELLERKARILGGIAVFRVAATTETELVEKKQRVEDAIFATKGALKEGYLPGGGYALASISNRLLELDMDMDSEERVGLEVLCAAMRTPLMQIASNAGKNGEVVYGQCMELGLGFNAASSMYVDMVEDRIIDPALVVRCSLENAVSAAGMLITTECAIVEEEKEKE